MTKGKKWTLRLLGVAALALLICLCLLGSTMARYTSSGDGKGTLTVAIWDLEAAEVEMSADEAESVSPSDLPYYSDPADTNSAQTRTNQSAWIEALTMENKSAVDAEVTIALATDEETGKANIGMKFDEDFTWGIGWTGTNDIEYDSENIKYDGDGNTIAISGRAQTNAYAEELMAKFDYSSTDEFVALVNTWGVFSLELASDSTGTDGTTNGLTIKLGAGEGAYKVDDGTDSKTIYASVDWTSVYETTDNTLLATVPAGFYENPTNTGDAYYSTIQWEEFSDAVDTIIGMYVTTLSFKVTWTAVQDSTVPPTT